MAPITQNCLQPTELCTPTSFEGCSWLLFDNEGVQCKDCHVVAGKQVPASGFECPCRLTHPIACYSTAAPLNLINVKEGCVEPYLKLSHGGSFIIRIKTLCYLYGNPQPLNPNRITNLASKPPILRTAFSRWFSGCERAQRYLWLPWH